MQANTWLSSASASIELACKRCKAFDFDRAGLCQSERKVAKVAQARSFEHLSKVESLVTLWLETEGQLRLVASAQAAERAWLKRYLLCKRADAYRLMCSTPIDVSHTHSLHAQLLAQRASVPLRSVSGVFM